MGKRLVEYEEKTKPLIAYYDAQGEAVHVDALQPIDVVTKQLIEKLPDLSPVLNDP